jgi:hypothetical protein
MTENQEKQLKAAIKKILLRMIKKMDWEWGLISNGSHQRKVVKEFTEAIMYEIVVLEILKERKEKGVKI